MLREKYKKLIGIVCMLVFSLTIHAQYTVTGGNGTPYLGIDDTRMQVYMLYGMNNAEIRYTSTSTSHQWFRYQTTALQAEPVQSTQEGTTSVIRNIEEGYGYFVKESETIGSNRFVWIIDYSKYAFDIRSLQVADDEYQCYEFRLTGDINAPQMTYQRYDGRQEKIDRKLEVVYETLTYHETENRFTTEQVVTEVTDPFGNYYEPPLCDTDITLRGDQFANHFGIGKSMSTGMYQAVALEAHGDTTLISIEGANSIQDDGGSLSAPAEVRFTAFANEPVAATYRWTIYNNESPDDPLISFNGAEVDYTFLYKGTYTARLEVSDRTTMCVDSTYSVEIQIRESDLRVPNAFSPGTTPGINDEFRVSYKSLIRFKGWIFNRWGVELFHWTDPAQGWDGKKGGKYVSPGVYFYVIEAEGSDQIKYKKSGHINIIRPKNVQDQIIE